MANQKNYDFRPLTKHLGLKEILTILNKSKAIRSLVVIFVIFAVTPIAIAAFAALSSALERSIAILLAVGGTAMVIHLLIKELVFTYRLKEFAKLNGFVYVSEGIEKRNGILFGSGHSPSILHGIRLHDETTLDFLEIANYTFSIGYGKSESLHRYAYVRMKLPRRLPNMLLDSVKNNKLRSFANLPEYIAKGQTLTLEGNFNDYFRLYVPDNYQRDALYIFTPDLMLAFLEYSSDLDIEIIDDDLYLFKAGTFKLTNPAELERLFQLSERIHSVLHKNARSYWDPHSDKRASNLIAQAGKKLRKHRVLRSSLWPIIIGLIVVALAFIVHILLTYST